MPDADTMELGEQVLPFHERQSIVWKAEISSTAKFVLLAVNEHIGANGCCWPSYKRLATLTRMHKRTIQRAINELRDAGVIYTKRRIRPGTNILGGLVYRVDWDRLQEPMDAPQKSVDSDPRDDENLVGDSVETNCLHGDEPEKSVRETVETESLHSGDKLSPQCRQKVTTVVTESLHSGDRESPLIDTEPPIEQLSEVCVLNGSDTHALFSLSEIKEAIAAVCKLDLTLADGEEIHDVARRLADAGYTAEEIRSVRPRANWRDPPRPKQIPELVGRVRAESRGRRSAPDPAELRAAAKAKAERQAAEQSRRDAERRRKAAARERWERLPPDERDRRIAAVARPGAIVPRHLLEELAIDRFCEEGGAA